MTIHVPYFGLHEIDGVMHLVQGNGIMSNALGLPSDRAEVMLKYKKCPHTIDLKLPGFNSELFEKFFYLCRRSFTLRQFLPVALEGSSYIIAEGYKSQLLINKLSHLSSPIVKTYYQPLEITNNNLSTFINQFKYSNLTRIVLANIQLRDIELTHNLINLTAFQPAHLILVGPQIPLKGFEESLNITTVESEVYRFFEPLTNQQIRTLGAAYLSDRMRKFTTNAQ